MWEHKKANLKSETFNVMLLLHFVATAMSFFFSLSKNFNVDFASEVNVILHCISFFSALQSSHTEKQSLSNYSHVLYNGVWL